MALFPLALSLFLFCAESSAAPRVSWNHSWRNLPELVDILKTVPEGLAVLREAEAKDPRFPERIKPGSASFTESTFSRTYSLIDGKEQITLHHEVTLNQGLSVADAVADLAHELVHFSHKGMLDPYRPGFELSQFIRNGIEGDGGELQALGVECQVAWALEKKYPGFPQHRLCRKYRRSGDVFDRETARLDYYALGNWYAKAATPLQGDFPEISAHDAVFTSSYAGKPYPVALAEEFQITRKAACVNNQRKYRLIASQAKSGRSPASSSLWEESRRLRTYDRLYCQSGGAKQMRDRTMNP